MKLLLALALFLSACAPPYDGSLGNFCKDDGTCQGQLHCVPRRHFSNYGEHITYHCVLPSQPTCTGAK